MFRANGSGFVAGGNITWNTAGAITLAAGASQFNADGSGYVANQGISWDAQGNVTFSNAVTIKVQEALTVAVVDERLQSSAVLEATVNNISAHIKEAANGNPNLLENAGLVGFQGFTTSGSLKFPSWGEYHADYVASGQGGDWQHDLGVGTGSWDYYGHQTAWYHGYENINSQMTYCEWMCQEITDKLEPDTWYTLSFMLSGTANCEALQTWIYPNACSEYSVDGGDAITSGIDPGFRWTAGAWKRHTIKFKTRMTLDTTTPIKLLFRIQPQTSAEFFVYVSQIKLERGEGYTAWNDGNISEKLYDTGIDITKRKIDITADTLTVRNNHGDKVFGSDANGNLDVTAAISALSLNVKDLNGHVRLRFAMNNEQNRTVFIDDVEQPLLYNNDYPADTPMLIILDAAGNVIYSVAMTGARGYASYDNLLEYVSGFGTENLKTKNIQLYYDRAVALPRMQRPYFTDYNFQYGYRGTLIGNETLTPPADALTTPTSIHGVVRDIFVNESAEAHRWSLYTVNNTTQYKPRRDTSIVEYSCAISKGTTVHSVYISDNYTVNGECAMCWDSYNDYLTFISTLAEFKRVSNAGYGDASTFYEYISTVVKEETGPTGSIRLHELLHQWLGAYYYDQYCQFLIDNYNESESEMEITIQDFGYLCPMCIYNTTVEYGDTYSPVYYTY